MTSGRVRALTRKTKFEQIKAAQALDVIKLEMKIHLAAGQDYLSVDHHKTDSGYAPTYRYQGSWVASRIRENSSGLVRTLSNDVVGDRGRHYAVYVAGTEKEESPQVGDWLGPWNQLVDALRNGQTQTF